MRLLGIEQLDGRLEKAWSHVGDDGRQKITIEIVQDVAPILRSIERQAKEQSSKSDLHFKASIPVTMIDDASKINAKLWGITVKDAFSELIQQKTDRAKRALKLLTEGRDFRKLQAKNYARNHRSVSINPRPNPVGVGNVGPALGP